MQLLRLGAAALNQTPLDWNGNRDRIIAVIHEAKKQGISVLCLPELCIPGYGCEDAFFMPHVAETCLAVLHEIVPHTQGIVVSVGLPVFQARGLFNTACLIANGVILGFVAKQHLAGDGLYYEPRWFKPWPAGVRSDLVCETGTYPLGDIVFEVDGVRIGFEICEDAWVPTRPGRTLASRAVDVILNPSASYFAFSRHAVRERFVVDGSRAFSAAYVYANLLGCEAGRIIFDGDCMIASQGRLLAQGTRFSFQDFSLCSALVDLKLGRGAQAQVASFTPPLIPDGLSISVTGGGISFVDKAETVPAVRDPFDGQREEEFSRAAGLGLFDYLRKGRARGYVVSLSGGADSSAVSCLVHQMVQLGVAELGVTGFCSRLGHIAALQKKATVSELMSELLTCVSQPTRNTSELSRTTARELAREIGARFMELDVDGITDSYVKLVEQQVGFSLTWKEHDIALQNVQARVRSPGAWLIANLRGAVLLATSDRSELSVGYATMDGDTSGGLDPIGGVDKVFLRQWLRWLGARGLTSLKGVHSREPTPELRPLSEKQEAEKDLMPYDVLDVIERLAIHARLGPIEVYERARGQLANRCTPGQLRDWVARFFELWARSQWKRERMAPSFHLDNQSLDPKTWCRFPILSGNFERELAKLRSEC